MVPDKSQFTAAMVWLSITLFYCYQYLLRMLPNIIMPELTQQFDLSTTQFGLFAGIYYVGYIAAHIPIGIAFSQLSSRVVLLPCVVLTVSGLIPIIYSSHWNYLLLGRLCIGIGSSAASVGALQLFRIMFPQHFTRMLGAMVLLGFITVVYASGPLTQILTHLGIERMMHLLIAAGVGLAGVIWLLLPRASQSPTNSDLWQDVKSIIGNKKLVATSVFAGLMVGPLEGFSDAWGNAFIQAVHGFDRESSNAIIAYLFIGMCMGCAILPYWADKTRAYYATILSAAGVMTLCFIYLSLGRGDALVLKSICLIIGFFCAYQVIILSKVTHFVPEYLSGMAGSITNMMMMGFGPLFHYVIALNMNTLCQREVSPEIVIDPRNAYLKGLAIIPIAMTIALIGFVIIIVKERWSNKTIPSLGCSTAE